MAVIGLPVNNGNLSAKLGGIINTPNGGISVTPALAAAVSADAGKTITPSVIRSVLVAAAPSGSGATPVTNLQVDPGNNITSMVNSINTSDVGTIDSQGNITDYIGNVSNGVSSFFTDMLGATGGNIAEYGFFGLLAVAAVYAGRKFFHSKTGLIRPKF